MNATILALDASSTTIGWVIYDGGDHVGAYGQIALRGDNINERCRLARTGIGLVLVNHTSVDYVAIESPASPHKKALIPQCYVSGAIRALLAERQIPIVDIAPQHAKQALAGKGNASKSEMQERAHAYGVTGEHAADALGVALAAAKLVSVERVTA